MILALDVRETERKPHLFKRQKKSLVTVNNHLPNSPVHLSRLKASKGKERVPS